MKTNVIRRIIVIFVASGLVLVTAYLGLVGTKLVRGVSLTENPPSEVIRLQVLHAGGDEAGLWRMLKRIKGLVGDELEVQVVETGAIELRAVTRTVIVSRIRDLTAAGRLAERLGLASDDVWYQPLEHNTRQATATLILGPDVEGLLTAQETKKELQKES